MSIASFVKFAMCSVVLSASAACGDASSPATAGTAGQPSTPFPAPGGAKAPASSPAADGGQGGSQPSAAGTGGAASAAADSGGAGGATSSTGPDPAVLAMRAAFRDADYAQTTTLINMLDDAAKAHPDDAQLALYDAAVRLWRLSDAANDPSLDLLHQGVLLNEALTKFQTAATLDPSDGKIDAWVGILNFDEGLALSDDKQIAKGEQMLSDAVPKYHSFGTFVRGVALGQLPRTDPNFAQALDALFAVFQDCGVKLDLDHPDFTAPMDAAGSLCGEITIAPHNLEGVFLNLGDVAVKAGHADAARKLYADAKSAPHFGSWRYADMLAKRIDDADMNAMLFQDDDDSNDPVLASKSGMFCTGCHAQ